MIETKKQYEFLADLVPYGNEWRETIEALREVARGAKSLRDVWGNDVGDYGFDVEIANALDALPSWITEE